MIDGFKFLNRSAGYAEECELVKNCLKVFGFVCIKNPYYNKELHQSYTSIMQKYFEKNVEYYRQKGESPDCNKNIGYQRGLTPERSVAQLREFEEFREKIKDIKDQPLSPLHLYRDLNWRYIQWIKEEGIQYSSDIQENIVISKEHNAVCQEWGTSLVKTARLVSSMLEKGLNLEENALTSCLDGGEHLLAPTGTNLVEYDENIVLNKLHYDLNYFTIHGPSSYSGLHVWTNESPPRRLSVIAPEGHFLVQNGKQIEILTGGYLQAGFHEVINSKEARDAAVQKLKNGGSPFRVGSILFSQISKSILLQPLESFRNNESIKKYPPMTVDDHLKYELVQASLIDQKI